MCGATFERREAMHCRFYSLANRGRERAVVEVLRQAEWELLSHQFG